MRNHRIAIISIVLALTGVVVTPAVATNSCTFTESDMTWTLDGDCSTDATILIPDGYTLNGAGHTITAVDPPGGHFVGAVIGNAGSEAHVENLTVTADALVNVCDAGDDRLRGIMFEGASGSITHNRVTGINQGQSGCQEGNAIEVRNAPFDGTHPATVTVVIAHNVVTKYQKTGIVANGDVDVSVNHNRLGASSTQLNLAANTIQLGFGATGAVHHNRLRGNQWKGTSAFVATAILIFDADEVYVGSNRVKGNADVGLYVFADGGTYEKNHLRDQGADHVNSLADIGIVDDGANNTFHKNKVRGFMQPFDPTPLPGDKNKALPSG